MNNHRTPAPLGVHLQMPGQRRHAASAEDIILALDSALSAKALAANYERTVVHQFTATSIVIWLLQKKSIVTWMLRKISKSKKSKHEAIIITQMGSSEADRDGMQYICEVVRAYEYANGDRYKRVFARVREARHCMVSQAKLADIAEERGIS